MNARGTRRPRGGGGRGPKVRRGGGRGDKGGGGKVGGGKVGFWAEVFGCLVLVVVGSGLMLATGAAGLLIAAVMR